MTALFCRFNRALRHRGVATLFFSCIPVLAMGALRSADELKGLSLEELLDTKVISASRTLETWKTTPSAIAVVPSETIRRSGAVRLADALRLSPGLNVARSVGSSHAISARGFNSSSSNKLEVRMDGRSLYTPLLSGVFWEIQDTLLEDVDRIEIVRGPGGALWGSNAMNGVINIVTKHAKDTQGGLITAAAGNEERAIVGVRYGGKIGDGTYYRTYFKYHDRDDQIFTNGMRVRDGMQQQQGGLRFDSALAGGNQLTLQGDVYANSFGVHGRPDAESSGGNVLGRWTHAFNPDSELQIQAYFDHGRRDVPLQFREDRKTYDLELQHRFKMGGRQEIVIGGEYEKSSDQTAQTGRTFVFFPSSRGLERVSFFAQDRLSLVPDRATLTVGARVERNDYSGWETQPSVRLTVTPNDREVIWAGVSRAVRAPTRVDVDSRFIPNPASGFVLIEGTPGFRSEAVVAYELGYRVQPHPKLFVDVVTFFNDYTHLRTLEPGPGPFGLPLQIKNEREGETYGTTASITFQATPAWQLTGSYSYLHEDFHLRPGSRDSTGGSLEANDPRHLAMLRSSINLPKGIEFDWTLRYVSTLQNPRLPSYLTLDVRLAFRPREDWEIALVGQNLLDPAHPEFSSGANQTEVQRGFYGQLIHRF